MKKVYYYSTTEDTKKERIYIEYFGLMSKKNFIEKVVEAKGGNSNWIRQRISVTVNETDVALAKSKPGKLFIMKRATFANLHHL